MTLKENPIVEYFSSVRFALLIIPLLIVVSITGTIIPQGQPLGFYMEKYGHANGVIIEILELSNIYSSIWFETLLVLLCLNLIVCSLDRIPQVIKLIKKDNLNADPAKLLRNKEKLLFTANTDQKSAITAIYAVLDQKKWRLQTRHYSDYTLLFAEKCAWSRLGAYLVHTSILIIVLGALVGSYFGFKAFVFVPEGDRTSAIHQSDDNQSEIPLHFTLQCDAFDIDYYPNGMPKEYRSDLVIFEDNKEIMKKRITVNDPLTYSGLTFFQSSYQPIPEQYIIELKKTIAKEQDKSRNIKQSFFVTSQKKQEWQDQQVRFEMVETGDDGHGHGPYKIWFDDGMENPAQIVVEDKKTASVTRGEVTYDIMVKQRFATGLQVVKDPGVWLVYSGFFLMLLGLYVAFFMSHRRLWISIQETGEFLTIILSGSANKNQAGFSKTLEKIATSLLNEKSLELRRI